MSDPKPYLQRLHDNRKVWLDGELVKNIETHSAFAGTVKSISNLLQLQQDRATRDSLVYTTERGKDAHLSFLIPKSKADLQRKREAYKLWADHTFGVMSRLSEYSRTLLTGWYANRHEYERERPGISEVLEKYYGTTVENDLLSTTAGHDPQINRSRMQPTNDPSNGALQIVEKKRDGVIVRGAKMLATAAPYVDEILLFSFHKRPESEKKYANLFFVPTNAEGLHIVCRESFADNRVGNHPISSRFDEMDAVLIFDHVFIPYERVLVQENPELAWKFRTDRVASLLSQHQTVVRLVSKLESIAAVANEVAESAGATQFLHVKEKLAELFIQLETIKALLLTSEHKAANYRGILLPDEHALATARNLGTRYYPRAIEIIQQIGAGGLLQTPSDARDLDGPIGHLLQAYFRGTDRSAEERTKLFKLSWDLIGSPLASRHELYERFYSGDPVRTFAAQYNHYQKKQELLDFAYEIIKESEG